jgi:hypothetical protein
MLKSNLTNIKIYLQRSALLVVTAVFISSSFIAAFAPSVSAKEVKSSSVQPATSYAWQDRQTISVTGGSVKAGQGLRVDANNNAPSAGSGIILMTEVQRIEDCPFLGLFCSTEDVPVECFVTMSIALTGLNRGVLSAVQTASVGASNGPNACLKPAWDTYNGKVVNITGTRPGDASGTAETASQKTVFFVIKSNFKEDTAPASVNLAITGTASKNLVANKRELNGNITFNVTTALEPGTYTARVNNPPTGLTVEPKNFTKVKFSQITVNLGDAEGFADRQIEVSIEITHQDPGAKTYGPLVLTLYDAADETVKTGDSNSFAKAATTEGTLGQGVVNLNGVIDDVSAGTYKLCIGVGTSQCQDVTKKDGSRLQVQFKITGTELSVISASDLTTTCAIPGIGWLLCPVLGFMGSITDGMYGIVSGLLVTDTNSISTDSGTYTAWSAMRNFANVGFVIVFLVIIFSQISNIGVTNYGVKKTLPRLIIVAILVNVSFFLCQIAVDLSNIIGGSLPSLFTAIPIFDPTDSTDFGTIGGEILAGAGGAAVVGGAGTVVFFANVGILIPILLAALLSIIVTLGILVLRQVLVILLVVVAPLAFLAMLLPNTEKLFKQWRKIGVAMLLIYPLIALLFGASKLAAGIIVSSTEATSFQQLFGLAAMFLPLFLAPVLLKNSLNAIPAIGSFATKLQNRANGLVSKGGKELYNSTAIARGLASRKQARANYHDQRYAEGLEKGGLTGVMARGIPGINKIRALPGVRRITKAGQYADEALSRSAAATVQKAKDEEVAAAKVAMQNANNGQGLSGRQRQDLAMYGKVTTADGRTFSGGVSQKAAIQEQLRTGSYDEVAEIVNNSGGSLAEFSQTIGQGLVANGQGAKDPAWTGKNIDDITQGKIKSAADATALSLSAIDQAKFTPEAFAAMHNTARQRVIDAAKASSNPKHLQALKDAAAAIRDNDQLRAKLANEGVTQIAGL